MPRFHSCILLLTLAMPAGAPVAARAQSSGGPYQIDSSAIAGGGARLAGGSFELSGTTGQPATSTLTGSTFSLQDGFWAPTGAPGDVIFSNGFES